MCSLIQVLRFIIIPVRAICYLFKVFYKMFFFSFFFCIWHSKIISSERILLVSFICFCLSDGKAIFMTGELKGEWQVFAPAGE